MRRVSENENDEHRYDDMLKMSHPVSKNHRQMPQIDRAAQFAPFAALTGYNESILDASRKPEKKIELSESQSEELNERIAVLAQHVKQHPVIAVRYYQQENTKEHVKITGKTDASKKTDLTEKRKRIETMEKEEAVRQNARGQKEIMGRYVTERKQLKRIEQEKQQLLFTDGTTVEFANLFSLDCALFGTLEEE